MELPKDYKNKLKTWIKRINGLNSEGENYSNIIKHHNKIYDYIQKYSNKNTKKIHLSTLAKIFNIVEPGSKLYKKYSDKATNLFKELKEISKEQILKPQRIKNFMCYVDIIKKREELKEEYEKDKKNNKANLKYVLLCLYTMQPPLRMEYKNMKIVNKVPDKENNYILKKGKSFHAVIQNDKVIKSHGPDQFQFNEELNSIIKDSLKAYPRTYILSTQRDGNKPLNKQGFEAMAKDIFKDKNISVDALRSAYITHFYNSPNISFKDKEELAKKMRHSAIIAELEYKKINTDCGEADAKEIDKLRIKGTGTEPGENIKNWQRHYYLENKKRILDKRAERYKNDKDEILRRNIIKSLNKGKTKRAYESTIKKYELVFNSNNNKWE